MVFFRASFLSFLCLMGGYFFILFYNFLYWCFSCDLFFSRYYFIIPFYIGVLFGVFNSDTILYGYPFLSFLFFLIVFFVFSISGLCYNFVFKYRIPDYGSEFHSVSVKTNYKDIYTLSIQHICLYLLMLQEELSKESFFYMRIEKLICLYKNVLDNQVETKKFPLKYTGIYKVITKGSLSRAELYRPIYIFMSLLSLYSLGFYCINFI